MADLRPFFYYFGGKWRAAPKYPAPARRVIIEPFAGAAGYSTRYADHDVRLYDLDERICGLWHYLIPASADEIRSIPTAIQSTHDLPDSLCQEAKWVVGYWIQGGCASPRVSRTTWEKRWPNDTRTWCDAVRERLASQVDHIRHWTITQATYRDILPTEATWFVDPPYIEKGTEYRHGSKGIDYGDLAQWCQGLLGQVMVCENEGADWLPFEHLATTQAAHRKGRAGRNVSREVLWTNSEPADTLAAA